MKKIFLGLAICLAFACSDSSEKKVNEVIDETGDSLIAKVSQAGDSLKSAKDELVSKIPKIEVNVSRSIPVSLQWISMEKQGSAMVTKKADGWFTIKGEQTNANNEFLKIDGKLKRIDADQLTFEGTIITYIKTNNNGAPCEKNGNQTFSKKGDRKYYRLQNMKNCEGGSLVDYVDLYNLDELL